MIGHARFTRLLLALGTELGDDDGQALGLEDGRQQQADGAGAAHQCHIAGLRSAAGVGMVAHGQRLDQRGLVQWNGIGDGMHPAALDGNPLGQPATTPENSCPMVMDADSPEMGCGWPQGGMKIGPSMNSCRSVPQMPHQATSMPTVPGSTTGSGMSSMRMSPRSWKRAAFMIELSVLQGWVGGRHSRPMATIRPYRR